MNTATSSPTKKRAPPPSISKAKAPEGSLFEWEGKLPNGQISRGETRAPGESTLRNQLRARGITSIKIKKMKVGRGKKVTQADIALLTRQLHTMLKSGVPLLQSFELVGRGSSNPSITTLLATIKSDIESGKSLVQAFRRHPLQFDSLYCNLIAAGEQAGILETILDRLAVYKEKMEAIRGKIKAALFYPAAIMVVAAVVVTAIMLFVIPAFQKVFASFGADLPTPTVIVIGMSNAFLKYWYLIFGGVGGGIYFFMKTWQRSLAMQIAMDRIMIKAPLFGPLIEKSVISRWLRTLATMFSAGTPLVEALDTVAGAAGNHVYMVATKSIQKQISSGTKLSVAMQQANIFPNMVLQMVAIGEESGALDSMLGKAADIYDREIDDMVESLSSLMEPIIMAVLGVLIGGLVVAMYLPIFKMGQAV